MQKLGYLFFSLWIGLSNAPLARAEVTPALEAMKVMHDTLTTPREILLQVGGSDQLFSYDVNTLEKSEAKAGGERLKKALFLQVPDGGFDKPEDIAAAVYAVDAEDPYTLATDRYHFQEVAQETERLWGADCPRELITAALFHDIERWIKPAASLKLGLDEDIRKNHIHPWNSVRYTRALLHLLNHQLPESKLALILNLIQHHDVAVKTPMITLHVQTQEELDYFWQYGFGAMAHPHNERGFLIVLQRSVSDFSAQFIKMQKTIADADALNYFQRTYYYHFLNALVVKPGDIYDILKRAKKNYERISEPQRHRADEFLTKNLKEAKPEMRGLVDWANRIVALALGRSSEHPQTLMDETRKEYLQDMAKKLRDRALPKSAL